MATTFEEAMDIAIEALKVQLKRFKEKVQEKSLGSRQVLMNLSMASES
jgi:putative sigma-54 modulation protein